MRGWVVLAHSVLLLAAFGPGAASAAGGDDGHGVAAAFTGQELRIEFDDSMQVWDNQGSAGRVTLRPAVPVRCEWSSDTVQSCRPVEGARFAGATRYRIDLAPGLTTQAGDRLPALGLDAETARPVLHASLRGWSGGAPRIELSSPAAVDAAGVGAVLRLSVDGQAQPLPPVRELPRRGAWDHGARFMLQLPDIAGHDRIVSLSVLPGLRSSEGPLTGVEDRELVSAVVNERFRLRGALCAGRSREVQAQPAEGRLAIRCMPGETLSLVFSEAPDDASRAAFAGALPDAVRVLGWDRDWGQRTFGDGTRPAAVADRGYRVALAVDRARATLALDAAVQALRADSGDAPLVPVSVEVRTGDYRPVVTAPRQQALLADGAARPVMAETVNAAAPYSIEVAALGRGGLGEETLRVPAATAPNAFERIVSETTATALEQGGWALWQLPATPPDWRGHGQQLQFAAPDFELVAITGRRELLAWASAWEDGAAVAGARVELLRFDAGTAEVVARGVADADGVARLALPGDIALEAGQASGRAPAWLLRAEAGRGRAARRAVLPIGHDWRGDGFGHREPMRTWGVADRPLYRAGDTVRYRLWQRRSAAGRLLRPASPPAPVELRLQGMDEFKLIKAWPVTPGADGSIAGELALPAHLPDGDYCVGTGERWNIEGTCFFVGTFRAQDLWVEARTDDRVLRDGDRFVVTLEAGYYSGGPAASVQVPSVTTTLTGLRLQDAYPAYGGFTFVDVTGARDGIRPAAEGGGELRTDAGGRLRIEVPLDFAAPGHDRALPPPAFGQLQLVAEARLEDREGTASNAVRARYARHERYVGLRLHPEWPDAQAPVAVEAVVIDADGVAVEGADVEVDVEYLPGLDDADAAAAAQTLARCALATGAPVPCDFPRARSGRYRLTARSGDAAPAEITRYIHVDGTRVTARGAATELELVEAPAAAGDPVRVLLRQPHARARVLFVHSSGEAILGHQAEDAVDGARTWVLQPPPAAAHGVTLTAYVFAAGPARAEDGYRVPRSVSTASVSFELPQRQVEPPLWLAFEAASPRPGALARVTLRNESEAARDVVLTVVDDALRALASDYLEYFDPDGRHWLGALRDGGAYSQLPYTSYGSWGGQGLRLALPWPDDRPAPSENPQGAAGQGLGLPAAVGEPPVVFDEPSPMDTPAPPPAPPAPPAPLASVGSADASLDKIEVTGSRIPPGEATARGPDPRRGLRPRQSANDESARAAARVRSRFADTALWRPDIRLAPGEALTLELALPDNLTRWRAVAWSSDADDGFHMAEAALETGLPLEVRLQVPTRVYPGDAARLAANVRQSGGDDLVAQGRLVVDGMRSARSHVEALSLPAQGQGSFGLRLEPVEPGTLTVTASAEAGDERDAVAATLEVASPRIEARKLQAGWLRSAGAVLDIPRLPAGASEVQLGVRLHRGIDALVGPWTRDLHDDPHRGWEQILSRAVAAALAIERGDVADWPDSRAVVQEALDNAAVFQDGEGGFRFFAGTEPGFIDRHGQVSRVTLAAWTVRVFTLLRELGYEVPAHVEGLARAFLESSAKPRDEAARGNGVAAFAAAAHPVAAAGAIGEAWATWDALPLPARVATARALADTGRPEAAAAVARLLELAPARAGVRALSATPSRSLAPWMSSRLREQCALIELLGDHPRLAAPDVRRGLVAGLRDLYAGGVQSVDTQAGAQCLIALRDLARPDARGELAVSLSLDETEERLVLPPDEDAVGHAFPAVATDVPDVLRIAPETLPDAGASYVAELRYLEDAREARPSAIGLSIQRRHDVLRDGAWRPVEGTVVYEGDWLRITLVVDTSATRHFVAVTDAVPGGLRPTDLSLGGIAGLDLAKVSDEGSHWFGTRRLDPRAPKFYAEVLPAGRHEIHYFARAGNAGDYLAAPAVAEPMYGDASRARTGATRLDIAARSERVSARQSPRKRSESR